MKIKFNILITSTIAISLLAYFYVNGLNLTRNDHANAIISLGESMAENDIKTDNLMWFWYKKG